MRAFLERLAERSARVMKKLNTNLYLYRFYRTEIKERKTKPAELTYPHFFDM